MDFAVYGRWEAVHSLKMLSWGVGTFSNIENFILRTFIFGLFGTLSRPSRRVGPRLTCWMSSRSGDPCKCPQIDLHRQLCCERRPYLTDYRSSPDLLDVQQVRWALLGSRPLPDLPDVQWVGLASEAFAQSKMSGCRCWQSYWRSISQGILLSNLTKCAAPSRTML